DWLRGQVPLVRRLRRFAWRTRRGWKPAWPAACGDVAQDEPRGGEQGGQPGRGENPHHPGDVPAAGAGRPACKGPPASRPKHRLLHRPLVIMVTAKFRGLSTVPATGYLEDVSMHRIVGGVLVLVLGMAGAEAEAEGQDRQPATPEQQYQALLKEYNDAFQTYAKAYAEAKTPEEQQVGGPSKYPPPPQYPPQFPP